MNKFLLSLILGCICVTSCDKKWPFLNTSEKELTINVHRFDVLVEDYVSSSNFASLQKMKTEYPQETKILIENVLNIGSVSDPNINEKLRNFYTDTTVSKLRKDVSAKFKDMRALNRQLTKAFRKLIEEKKSIRIPQIYTQISALNQSIVVSDSIIGISLDKYLGADYPLYKRFYYADQLNTMEASRIATDCLVFYLTSEFPFSKQSNTGKAQLLDFIVFTGKIHWIVGKLMGHNSLQSQLGFTQEHSRWCEKNEKEIWTNLNKSGLLHTTDSAAIYSIVFCQNNKNISGMNENNYNGIGLWIGIRIIDAYMHNHPECTIGELLDMQNYRNIFRSSGYKPL